MMQAYWLLYTAHPVVHFAPWAPGETKGPLCNTLGWKALTWERYDTDLQHQVYLDPHGRAVLCDALQYAPEGAPVCRFCWRRWLALDQVLHHRQAEHG